MMEHLRTLKPDFVWGVATSAYQIEGAVAEDGRTPSIWDTFCQVPGAIDNGHTGDVACDHYHRWPEDVELMRQLGVDAYRFSIAWPRVLPDGTGTVNAAGLDFYDRLVDGLLAAGIRPYATLYHWDLPQALQDRGGWPERDTATAFADYTAVVAARLGDRVSDWMTLNEPLCSAWIGHLEGRMAPGIRDLRTAVHASHHLLLGHGLATAALRAAVPEASVGMVVNLSPCTPASQREEDVAAARRADGHNNRWWLDPLYGRGYPRDMVEAYGFEPPVRDGDLELISAPTDFLGLNYYFRQIIVDDPTGTAPQVRSVEVPDAAATAMGWEVYPAGIEQLLLRLSDEYDVPKIYVTESGSAWPDDQVGPDGQIADHKRTEYLMDHISAALDAEGRGAPLAGYFAWSLLDNFEWSYGYDKRFGLVHVDYDTQVRTIKASGHRYAQLIREHTALRPAQEESA
jgi:beta-glucosidase